jgi:hypothetical protein
MMSKELKSLRVPVPSMAEAPLCLYQDLSSQSQERADGHVVEMVHTSPDNPTGCTVSSPSRFRFRSTRAPLRFSVVAKPSLFALDWSNTTGERHGQSASHFLGGH